MNTVLPHDLLWGLSPSALPLDAPAWVREVVEQGHPVVVRRAMVAPGRVAVGVRGAGREQRFATVMKTSDITRIVRPEQLTLERGLPAKRAAHATYFLRLKHRVRGDAASRQASLQRPLNWPALRALQGIRPLMMSLGLPWGVTGSAGFELASGIPALHEGSDLDLILRTPAFISRDWAAQLVERLESAPCRIDVQLQTPCGALMLREWAGSARQVLLKSATGACLVDNPWQLVELSA
ncbi:phosphoribosyl-dephospho-CoA transferase [Pseudomonas sp. JUb42]|jgi:phosphoribosyl-dephospho-CoA transferase|uniref:malonate decarboxylase holo-ACP synthase n=1 Tax=Pseudomonas sp. JUb42 TaxID=2940611 RepID=UPI002169E6EC|nr:malonate decarboxylase holo-ACP synthase [Pseudomonas sp. JUb42]MCS3469380.1 phosphoribosyl-dephospho-CoA transferase [Pseudomonas sp. JUb42]